MGHASDVCGKRFVGGCMRRGSEWWNEGLKMKVEEKKRAFEEWLQCNSMEKFYSQLNTSGREPSTCDTPVITLSTHPPRSYKVMISLEHLASSHTTRSDSQAHRQSNQHHIHTHVNIHTDKLMKYQRRNSATRGLVLTQCIHQSLK